MLLQCKKALSGGKQKPNESIPEKNIDLLDKKTMYLSCNVLTSKSSLWRGISIEQELECIDASERKCGGRIEAREIHCRKANYSSSEGIQYHRIPYSRFSSRLGMADIRNLLYPSINDFCKGGKRELGGWETCK